MPGTGSAVLVVAVLLVSLANGANDNAKGVGALIGSKMAEPRPAMRFANAAALLGSLAAVIVALRFNRSLVVAFGGSGLLPAGTNVTGSYLLATALGAATTVLVATRLGIPVSTTHALLGALAGAGIVNVDAGPLIWSALVAKFVVPLLLSPVLSGIAALALYPLVRGSLAALGLQKQFCLCVESVEQPVIVREGALTLTSGRVLTVDEASRCETRLAGRILTVPARAVVTGLLYLTGGAVCFARALNDTPKIVALLVASAVLGIAPSMLAIAVAMLVGGVFFSRAVAHTMANRIAGMDVEQGLAASAVTAALVIAASVAGLPVSTTHVSVGALAGAGLSRGTARIGTIGTILLAWVTTLPLAAMLAAGAYLAIS
jgi:PiT family inorganic phosphate transporter